MFPCDVDSKSAIHNGKSLQKANENHFKIKQSSWTISLHSITVFFIRLTSLNPTRFNAFTVLKFCGYNKMSAEDMLERMKENLHSSVGGYELMRAEYMGTDA